MLARGLLVAAALLLWTGSPAQAQPGECSPAYPDSCIEPPPPDLDCGDLGLLEKNFKVVGSDPHRFDRDGDGVGCEPYGVSGLLFGHGVLGLAFWIALAGGGVVLWWRRSRKAASRASE